MSHNPCPCESGFDYSQCCGDTRTTGLKQVADLRDDVSVKLTKELSVSIDIIEKNPDLFPVNIDFSSHLVELVKMSAFWFSESTFLDKNRIQGHCTLVSDLDWLRQKIKASNWQYSPFIFHSAFCGSTLMSRALDLCYGCLPLREPDSLGSLLRYTYTATHTPKKEKDYLLLLMTLLSRRYDAKEPVVIKSNDYTNAYLTTLLAENSDFPVLIMYTNLDEFVAGCLKDDARKQWINERYQFCYSIFTQQFPDYPLPALIMRNSAEQAAVYWCFNMLLFLESIEKYPTRIKTLEFSQMLSHPIEAVEVCGNWFSLNKRDGIHLPAEINWLLGVHAKDTLYAYSPEQRTEDIHQILSDNQVDLQQAKEVAKSILKNKYPQQGLPNSLF